MKKVLLFFLLFVSFSYGADECGSFWSGSDYKLTLNSTNTLQSISASVFAWDYFYINVTEPGEVAITVSGKVEFSYDESDCPWGFGNQYVTSKTVSFSQPTDFNLDLTTTKFGTQNYTITFSFTPAAPQVPTTCSSDIGLATLNEIYSKNTNDNFVEAKVFDPFNTDYSQWSILQCDESGTCAKVTDFSAMTQNDTFWFYRRNVPNLPSVNSSSKFTLLLVDGNNDVIDALNVNNASGVPLTCLFPYDTTVTTTSASKGVSRLPDGTGDWDDSAGTGDGTGNTEGENNDGSIGATIIADYRLDACEWDGTTGEVVDSAVNAYHGTALHGANTTDASRPTCRQGDFLDNYVELPANFPHLNGSRTITAWFNTSNRTQAGQRIFADDENNNDGSYALSLGDPGEGRLRFYIRGLNGVSLDTNTRLSENTWYFVAATFDATTMTKSLYVYDAGGTLVEQVSASVSGVIGTPTGSASIGGEVDGAETSNRFQGQLDEVKLFGSSLSKSDIETILSNEIAGNNYDGSARTCNVCQAPCGTYTGDLGAIQFVGGQLTLNDTYSTPTMTHANYRNNYVFSENPVIFVLPNTNGGNPANMRVKNVDSRGFDIAMVEPQGEDGAHIAMLVDYFAINVGPTSSNRASQVYQLGNQIIEVGYIKTTKQQKGYDTQTNEWEIITPKGNFCNPVVVTQIQGMVNEPNYNPQKPSEPFLTTATQIDGTDIKLSLERSETNVGTVAQPEMIAYMIGEANVQDSFIDDVGRAVAFETIQTPKQFYGWDDSAVSASFVNSYPSKPLVTASLNSRDSLDGGWFRKSNHTTTNIALKIDEDRRTNRSGAGNVQDTERSKKKNAANNNPTTPESAGIFVFDGAFVKTGNVSFGTINAVNVSEKDNFTGNIATQIVGSVLDLALVAREDDNVTLRDANISKLEIVNCADDSCLDCEITTDATTIFDNAASPISISSATGYALLSQAGVSYVLPEAKKIQKLRITELNKPPVCSFDTFATRPKEFGISSTSPVYAGEDFLLNFTAKDFNGANSAGYNESENDGSFVVDYTETRPECNFGEVLNHDIVTFSNGLASNVDANFTGIAQFLTISVAENNGTEFAVIDNDDTPDLLRLITPDEVNISVLPYELNVTATIIEASTGQNWLYMASTDDMNVTATVRIQANNKNHDLLRDFNATCYAQDVDFNFDMGVFDGDSALGMNYVAVKGILNPSGTSLGDIDQSMRIPASDFINGTGEGAMAFNVNRSYESPVSPFKVSGLGATITSGGSAKELYHDTSLDDGNFTFYYARLRADDIVTTTLPASTPAYYEVYDNLESAYTSGWKQNTLFWYVNNLHNNNAQGEIKEAIASSNAIIDNDLGFGFDYAGIATGEQNLEITSGGSNRGVIHLKTQPWLWYVPAGFGSAYDEGSGSDCTMHPCINYALIPSNGALKIQSGDFNGTAIPDVNREEYQQQGVKLFR